ncbi:ABC transporter ATP-binding protein [Kineococcus rhizosphaerae]|uniref:ABC-type quaternary amine transporter n=1 Tax=Kineococcus rhizosphaerae TaxID=559628 RepID=A0A2T0R5I7_9ACTN|nr:ATP-binding cassette domain-containing protein [Kineococcus rhizosphaerae]PRY16033.1 osmoprotectant transport system ATP-binding protein [Kineococcus rhizosphaerae]
MITDSEELDTGIDDVIRFENVVKRYGRRDAPAVTDLTFSVRRGELVALVGPSGCGKSTILRMVNRLVEPTGGRVVVDGRDTSHVDVVDLRRGIGYVIQAGGLLPHRTIRQNVATVPRLLGWDASAQQRRVDELLDLVGLDPATYGDRYPAQLSGGQQQRVGVARALAADPPVLLMDEPFGAVDPVVRDRLQTQFRRIQTDLRKTVLFVTHDLDEAVRIADRIALFSAGGVLEQFADPRTLLSAPATEFVVEFTGSDRGLRRLAVTPLHVEDLAKPLVLAPGDGAAYAATALDVDRGDVAVVVSDGRVLGWVARGRLREAARSRDARVRDVVQPFTATVSVRDGLRGAFSALLAQDAPLLPVLDGDRYVGALTPDVVHDALRRDVDA